MDEFERIAGLRANFAPPAGSAEQAGILLGIGDDAAVLTRPASNLVLSVDAAVDGVHFRPGFADWATLGARAFSAAMSDLAAMGAQPRAALSALIVPLEFGDAELAELGRGQAEAAARHHCPVVGGNLARGTELSITTTVIGEVRGVGLTRAGACAGDAIYVTGVLGAAALGLAWLEAPGEVHRPEDAETFVARWRYPNARVAEGLSLVAIASAAIDVSDGLLQDLGHLCSASGVGAALDANALPTLPGFRELARTLGHDPMRLALAGGEDYELVYTLPASCSAERAETLAAARRIGTRIGVITSAVGEIMLRDADGHTLALPGRGYRHFSG
jgi:thiamine-monophosphate kinase